MTEKQKWIDEVQKSIDGISRANGNPFLLTRILASVPGKVQSIPARTAWLTIASLLLLAMLNLFCLRNWQPRETRNNEIITFAYQYQLMNSNTISY